MACLIHQNLVLAVLVHTQGDRLIFEIVNLIQVSEEEVTHNHEITAGSLHLVGVDSELAPLSFSLVEVKLWLQLEDLATDLEANWLHILGNL